MSRPTLNIPNGPVVADTVGRAIRQDSNTSPVDPARGYVVLVERSLKVTKSGLHLPDTELVGMKNDAVKHVCLAVGAGPVLGLHPVSGDVVYHDVPCAVGDVVCVNPLHRVTTLSRDGVDYYLVGFDSIVAIDRDASRYM